jgi:hypothetical protein
VSRPGRDKFHRRYKSKEGFLTFVRNDGRGRGRLKAAAT